MRTRALTASAYSGGRAVLLRKWFIESEPTAPVDESRRTHVYVYVYVCVTPLVITRAQPLALHAAFLVYFAEKWPAQAEMMDG